MKGKRPSFDLKVKSVMTVVSVCGIYPLIQVIFTVIEFLRLCLPHELYVYLRVKLPTLRQLQLKNTKEHKKNI